MWFKRVEMPKLNLKKQEKLVFLLPANTLHSASSRQGGHVIYAAAVDAPLSSPGHNIYTSNAHYQTHSCTTVNSPEFIYVVFTILCFMLPCTCTLNGIKMSLLPRVQTGLPVTLYSLISLKATKSAVDHFNTTLSRS